MAGTIASQNSALSPEVLSSRGREVALTPTQGRILYGRNMILLLLSLIVGGRTLLAICGSWQQSNSVRRFANLMVGILLLIELIQTIVWLIGVNIVSAVHGTGPWIRISLERGDKWCYGGAILDFWTDMMVFLWHAVMAYIVWQWIVRQRDLKVLTRRLWYLLPVCSLVAACVTLLPIKNQNLGLWPHGSCFVRRSWKTEDEPMLGVMLNRMIILPLCWLVIVVLNCWTIHYLRREPLQHFGAAQSIKRLQVRLVLITTVFALLWTLQSVPLYLHHRTFELEFATKWAYGIGFVDALIFGWPTSLTYIYGPCCLPLLKRLGSSFSRGFNVRDHQIDVQQHQAGHGADSRLTGGVEARRSTSLWETLVPSAIIPTLHEGNDSRPASRSGATGTSKAAPRQPPATGLSPFRIFATTFDMNYRNLPEGGPLEASSRGTIASDSRWAGDTGSATLLKQGLEAWIPAGGLYHLYVIAVQRCRVLAKLRNAIQDHLGGSGRYVLAGLSEIGDALSGKMALLVFARAVDVESGALRLLASNQRPVILRELRGGCKGMVGFAFRYYDTAFAMINAHLPGTSLYPGDRALEERDKHISSMLQSLRLGGDHELWDAHLQYHHVLALGNFNFRMRLDPHEMSGRIQASSRSCQAGYEVIRERAGQQGVGGTGWSWRGHGYNRFWSHIEHQDTRTGMTETAGWDVGLEDSLQEPDELVRTPSEAWAWVKQKDVLSRRLQRGLLFSGFTEPDICFPPSFKWRVGASADDYTESGALESAYVTGRQSYRQDDSHRTSSSSSSITPKWTPSYTDRILTRSLMDMQSRLVMGPYDLCDHGPLTSISDHRPVAQALTVLVDTSYVLPKKADLREQGRVVSSMRKRDRSTTTAQAMAAAATVRHVPEAGGGGDGAWLPGPGPSSSSSSKPYPLLMCLALSDFSFELAGLHVTREEGEESTYGRLYPQESVPEMKRSESDSDSITSTAAVVMGVAEEEGDEGSAQGELSSSEEGDKEEEEKVEEGGVMRDIEAPPQPRSLPILSPLPPSLSLAAANPSTASSGWRRIPSLWGGANFSSRGASPTMSRASSVAGRGGALSFVDHILLAYPLPCEDPLLPLRRAQALGDSFGEVSPPSSGQGRGASLSGEEQRSGREFSQRASLESSTRSSGGGTVKTRDLGNVHKISWNHRFEHDTELPLLRRDHSSSSSIFSLGASTPSLASRIGGAPRSSQQGSNETTIEEADTAARVNVLTMGPPRPCQHALIKFMDKRGEQLGQGIFHVELQEGSCGREPSLMGGSGGACMQSERRRGGELVTRQTVELAIGGRYRGTVNFTLGVKVRKRAEDGSSLQVPQ